MRGDIERSKNLQKKCNKNLSLKMKSVKIFVAACLLAPTCDARCTGTRVQMMRDRLSDTPG